MAYDKTEMNAFVQALYDQKMRDGKHGHYETMFHVVHKAIEHAEKVERVPLSDVHIEAGRHQIFSTETPYCPCDSKTMRKAVQWAERVHGITKKGQI